MSNEPKTVDADIWIPFRFVKDSKGNKIPTNAYCPWCWTGVSYFYRGYFCPHCGARLRGKRIIKMDEVVSA